MQPTISESEVISKFRVLLADKPQDVQLKVLWLLLEAIAADIDQIKAYTARRSPKSLHARRKNY